MKLSQEQIAHLYGFTRQHHVEYYDLQTELVDHLANSIEEQWQENPKLSFEAALNVEFKKFGIFGFMDVVGQRKIVLQKRYEKIAWDYLKDFFKLHLIIFTLVSLVFVFFFLNKGERMVVIVIQMAIYFSISIYFWVARMINKYKTRNSNSNKWLFEEVLRKHSPLALFGVFIFTSYYVPQLKEKLNFIIPYSIQSLYDSAFIVYFGLFIYIVKIRIPLKTKEYLKQTYPEYNFQNV
ncbi:hypothetical protein ACFQZF_03205 [Flavobacterium myungsuense]|uniref:Uncharacterized protein n=1 Tax=Flavobacterium myungsuense TaxID=651823 RepID=A0ABW3J3L4_9FLAO